MDYQDKILAMARNAPLTPTMVGKAVGKDSLIASAMLSAMVEKGLLKISHVKVGSTPLYYDPAQEEHLQNYASYLNDKDRQVYVVLKDKKVLREATLDPLSRVCIKNLKDFARPLEVSFNNNKEIFWKWYMLSDTEAEPIIRNILAGAEAQPPPAPEPPVPEPEPEPEPAPPPQPQPEPEPEPPAPVPEVKKPKPKPKKAKKKKVETQKRIVDKIKDMIVPKALKGSDKFLETLNGYFSSNSITVIKQLEQKRKSEFEFIIEINSAVGPLAYYCNAKDKKRVGEADLSNAFVQGQLVKLPVLFLITGSLTKQAEKISKDFKCVAVRKI
jgi:hypothetical protein